MALTFDSVQRKRSESTNKHHRVTDAGGGRGCCFTCVELCPEQAIYPIQFFIYYYIWLGHAKNRLFGPRGLR
jgi:hypothetical protein